ncbi:fatty acid desaturase [Synechococcus sp. CS-602]|nr:fatty acid desaturase [Synechococcus sp. CS-601]MCT0204196.1 fatty acid desaturase [Synechococcus sp. CS-602]MCT0247323.1 fatty acid desaturase [Synechococcus sp. CS-601]
MALAPQRSRPPGPDPKPGSKPDSKPVGLARPVAGVRVLPASRALHRPRHGKSGVAVAAGTSWVTIGFMAVIHVLALVALLPRFWSVPAVVSLLVLYWITACLGVTVGYHRLLSHRSFRVPHWLERFFATCGALSCQHGPIDWSGLHRHHHKFSDTDVDHHNSHRGFWWSHMGWMFQTIPATAAVPRLTGDLQRDPYYRWLNNYFLLLQIPLGLLLFWIGTVSGAGGWALVLWGIPLRLVIVYHFTWLVNSATHRWGQARYPSGDQSRNNPWVAALTFGEGWHNNHHAFPHSARHGFGPAQIDLTWQHIRLLRALGLATHVRLPRRTG